MIGDNICPIWKISCLRINPVERSSGIFKVTKDHLMLLTEHTGKLPDGWKRIPLPPKTQLDEGNKRKGDYSKTEAC